MRTIAFIGTFFRGEVEDSMLDELLEVYPEGGARMNNNGFKLFLPVDEPATQKVLDVLKSHRMQPTHFGMTTDELKDQRRYYQLTLHREYSPSELDQFDLFELRSPPEAGLLGVERRANGSLAIPSVGFPDDADADHLDFMGDAALREWIVVPDRVHDILAASSFARQSFLAVETESTFTPQGVQSYWELTSDFVMPPVAPTMVRLDHHCRRVWPGGHTGGQRVEGLYKHAELRYRASDLRALEPFDVARTFESFWGPDNNQRRPDYCPLVVSKRFYNVCRKHNFKIDWHPVHIDPI